MSRYIDADALMEKYNVKDTNIAECLTDKQMARAFERFCIIADAVEKQPTVDAVPVVRCGECKWWKKYRNDNDWGLCEKHDIDHPCNCEWFCADGERRTDE